MTFFFRLPNTLKIFLIGALLQVQSAWCISAADSLIGYLNSYKSYRADFIQTIRNSKGQVLQQTKGKISFQRPGRFRWEAYQPNKQLLVADGQYVFFYDVGLEQVTQQRQKGIDVTSPASLLSADTRSLKKLFIVYAARNLQEFYLLPKDKNALFKTVTLFFQKGQLKQMNLMDKLDQATTVRFSNIEVNPYLKAKFFKFIMPNDKNVELVKDL